MSAVLHLVGVGPGDPDLLTIKAARILGVVDCVAYPQKTGTTSRGFQIAQNHLRPDAHLLPVTLPMKTEREPAQAAYDLAANSISERLRVGQSVAYLCEGDPFFYGSAMYISVRISSHYPVQVVPGITSVSAATAALGRPLVARSELLKILPATLPDEDLLRELASTPAAAILKVGRHLDRIRDILRHTGHEKGAQIIEDASGQNEKITPLVQCAEKTLPYFAIILCYKGFESWGSSRPESKN